MPQQKRKYKTKSLDHSLESSRNAEFDINQVVSDWEPLESGSNDSEHVAKARLMTSQGSDAVGVGATRTRQNRIYSEEFSDKFKNIKNLKLPFDTEGHGSINIKEAVSLCQKAYANISAFRNTIDVMTEFSTADIHLKGGNKESRTFIAKWLERANIVAFCDQFFREYFRSGNVFIYKFEGEFSIEDIKNLKKVYSIATRKSKIPLRYTVLNPKDIIIYGASSFGDGLYQKVLSQYELEKLRLKKTEEDKKVYDALPTKIKNQIDKMEWSSDGITITLEADRLMTAFYKKQDYEPFATPFGYPVLDDLDHKLALKRIDRAISKTIQQVVLLVTMGDEPTKGGVNQKAMAKMQELLQNETVGRTVVSDHTTKMQFIIPQVADILDPKKYTIVDADIKDGLQNIMFGSSEKFANQLTKIKVFLERLKEGRRLFMNRILQPEIKKICKDMGFKNYPKAFFEEIDLQDEAQFHRIWTRLLELGVLTPEQTFTAMKTGVLPEKEDILENQEKFVEERKKGYYNPIVGGIPFISSPEGAIKKDGTSAAPNPNANNNGRPEGATSNRVAGPIGQSKASADKHSIANLRSSLVDVSRIISKIELSLAKNFGLSELNDKQKTFAFDLAQSVITTRNKNEWDAEISKAIENPAQNLNIFSDNEITEQIDAIAEKYEIDTFQAALLYHSKC